MCGQGEMIWSNGDSYVGMFKNDRPHGEGTFKMQGITYIGHWENGKKHGFFKEIDSKGKVKES